MPKPPHLRFPPLPRDGSVETNTWARLCVDALSVDVFPTWVGWRPYPPRWDGDGRLLGPERVLELGNGLSQSPVSSMNGQ
jgi:hypothetical protein